MNSELSDTWEAATARVQLPPEASGLLYRPWETAFSWLLAHLDLVDIQGGQPPGHGLAQVSEDDASYLHE